MKILIFLVIVILSVLGDKRKVDCGNAKKDIDEEKLALYRNTFVRFEDNQKRVAKNSLWFESLIALGAVANGGADLMEFFVTLGEVENLVRGENVTIDEIVQVWTTEWLALGNELVEEGNLLYKMEDFVSARNTLHRAAMYLQVSERYLDHSDEKALSVYALSVKTFELAVNISAGYLPTCRVVKIPYYDDLQNHHHYLHGYWCEGSRNSQTTILAMGGFDTSAEITYHEVAVQTMEYGVNVLVFEGPGQGSVARFEKLKFRADWDYVMTQVVNFALTLGNVEFTNLVMWGRSFGGYLAPAGFAGEKRLSMLVADGGVYDMYQNVLCALPENLRELYYQSDPKLNPILSQYRKISMDLDFLMKWGSLGFEVDENDFDALFDAFEPFNMKNRTKNLSRRPIFINDPPFDTATGNQSQILMSFLETPSYITLHEPDWRRGGGLHCSVGSTSNANIAVMRWIISNQ